eukprot:gnl/Carplike_NY0171/1054_a1441_786.p1 GENE.gnl/Carplike_NY0171/1054_a1441_786~~gnl/Carplike_NY0171/1054_a1441_786.p1  ORF type:complete len:340 (-),score=18.23 gnl/Carplike_NY0171/1054_a1441_786:175-1194(-)
MTERLMKLKNGDKIELKEKSMTYVFGGRRQVVSTSPLNGGSREDLEAVFNFDETPADGGWCQMKADTYDAHLAIVAEEIGLDPERTTGLSTTVQIDNSVILKSLYHDHEIVVICTAGVDVNAARAGDPAGYDEATVVPDVRRGTVNIIVSCDVALPSGSLARMLITVTEAKTAALQELLVGSCYSEQLATGSGTDGVIVISRSASELKLSNTGAHSKLGEIISGLTKKAVKKALYLQTGLDAVRQLNVYERLKRFNLDDMLILLSEETCQNPDNVALTSVVVHLLDQMAWGALPPPVVLDMVKGLLSVNFDIDVAALENSSKVKDYVLRGLIQYLIDVE